MNEFVTAVRMLLGTGSEEIFADSTIMVTRLGNERPEQTAARLIRLWREEKRPHGDRINGAST